MAGTIDFSKGLWIDTTDNGIPDALAGSVLLGGAVGNPYTVYLNTDRTGITAVGALTGQHIVIGTNGDDSISLNTGVIVDPLEPVQTIRGLFGDDLLVGSSATQNRLFGDAGNDELEAGDLGDQLYGGDGNDRLIGGTGNDLLSGGDGHDLLFGMGGDDRLIGGDGNDELTLFTYIALAHLNGGDGNDLLDVGFGGVGARLEAYGGAGDDVVTLRLASGQTGVLQGGLGNDTLLVETGTADITSFSVSGFENVLLGGALVASAAQWSRFADIRSLFDAGAASPVFEVSITIGLAGTVNFASKVKTTGTLFVTGSDGNDVVTGRDVAADDFSGGEGNDRLFALGGNDTLTGGAGNDFLDGGLGNDRMTGGDGNDTYVLSSSSDTVIETGTGTADEIQAAFDIFTLTTSIENVTLLGTGDFQIQGTTAANVLRGNSGSNMIFGFDGDDRLYGNGGDDELHGEGENDILYGGDGNDELFGDQGSDRLFGNNGDDRLDGGFGFNSANGGAGADVFVFSASIDPGENSTRIADFQSGTDIIELAAFEFSFSGGLPPGALDESAFHVIGSGTLTESHRILYDPVTGALLFDADGSLDGGDPARAFGTLTGAPTISFSDFIVTGSLEF